MNPHNRARIITEEKPPYTIKELRTKPRTPEPVNLEFITQRKRPTMNPDPFNTNARTGHPLSTRNRRRSALPAVLASFLYGLAICFFIIALKKCLNP